MTKKAIQEIRDWRSSYRPFRARPENVSAFEEREETMIEYIDQLLEACNPVGDKSAGGNLRDMYAAAALTGLLAHRGVVCPTHPPGEVSDLASDAYAVADAMIAEREKRNA